MSGPALLSRKCKLRFFAYSPANFSEFKLPSSISFVWNLQTLIFQERCGLVDAPAEIWEMSQLRHVVCNNIRLPDPPLSHQEDDACVLRNLQTLVVQVVNFRWTEEACKRIPNIKKLHVVFDDVSTGYVDCLCSHYLHNLGSLQKLESLNMRFPFCTFNGEFPCLKFLRIDGCDVVYWAADTSAFRDLWQLQEIPSEMGEINTLKLIHLHHCSESAPISALEIKKEQESFGNDSLWVRVNVESLPIDSIRFWPFGKSTFWVKS